jgi:hypothetical protein
MNDVETMTKAAILRYCQDKTWGDVASGVGVSDATLWRWRQTEEWGKAVETACAIMKRSALGVAWKRLVFSAETEPGAPGVNAAKELLARIEGAVPQAISGDLNVRGELDFGEILSKPGAIAALAQLTRCIAGPQDGDAGPVREPC